MTRPIFITGTGTDIGKTIVSSFLKLTFQELGMRTFVFKPLQTGLVKANSQAYYPDIHWYKTALGQQEKDSGLYRMEPPASPHLAAKLTETVIEPFLIKEKIDHLCQSHDYVLVEGAGGLAVPIIEDEHGFYMTKDLIKDCQMSIIIAAPSGLGAIHDIVSTVCYAKQNQLPVQGLILNQFHPSDYLHQDNLKTIKKMLDIPILAAIPELEQPLHTTLTKFAKDYAAAPEGQNLKKIWEAVQHGV
ncbi:dethiobiotin synthetase [Scopulibacillus daqui]|uniref:ATP-dependent dethiobiotin synthetase BioD n=1 Tax=Scopulibacillus daqui TaxID=1469162 RepID=A0ABS2Q1W1_9BACL|nr:dethiobiotin synthase [Scopulibacillus daqui]MBM7646289.1 dethiobiotin synthetase [Scopulibacillus daqui]